ncbi:MAG: hypothetical protein A2146_00675 [Actinobacteria bacterium RBG_16_67_10]|nr:MAG: hypothetical protein A2146_00675 [Actinobacteria bacterium RBG_16_67_10]
MGPTPLDEKRACSTVDEVAAARTALAQSEASLPRATMVNHGAVWSDQHRFRQADGPYATVTERAYVVHRVRRP